MVASDDTRVETFAFPCGIAYFAVGLLGLMPPALQMPASDSPPVHLMLFHGELLGLFPVNVAHSAVHVAIGIWGLLAARSAGGARIYARSMAIFFAVLAVLGAAPGLDTLFGMLPLHGNDIWLHGATAAAAAYFGWYPDSSLRRR